MSDDQDDDGNVVEFKPGYGRPPKHSQFKKGQSGNPSGRPKGSMNLKSQYIEVLHEPRQVRIGGKIIEESAAKAMIRVMVQAALKNNVNAFKAVMNQGMKLGAFNEAEVAEEAQLTDNELAALQAFLAANNNCED